MWFQSTFWGLCILPLEFLHKTLRQPTLCFLTLANFYRKENFDLLKSQCSSPIIPSYDHMTFHMCFFTSMKSSEQMLHCSSLSSTSVICVTTSSFWALAFSFSSCGRRLQIIAQNGLFFIIFRHYVITLPQNAIWIWWPMKSLMHNSF